MGRRSSPTGSRKMYSGSHTLELRKTGRKTLIVVCGYLYLERKNSSFRLFRSICTSPITSLCLTAKFCIPFLFWGITLISREIEDNAFAKFWGVNKVYYGRCANGESSRTMPQSRVKEPEIHGLFAEYRRTINRGWWGESLQGISLV